MEAYNFYLYHQHVKIPTEALEKIYCFSLGNNAIFLCYCTINVELAHKYTYTTLSLFGYLKIFLNLLKNLFT